MRAFLRTFSQFLYFLAVLVAVPSLMVLGWHVIDPLRFLGSAPLGLSLGQIAAAAAIGSVAANAVAFLRPEDMTGWMGPFAGVLLLAFGGEMLLLFVAPM